jgi:ribosomal protein L11 methyltransferase
MTARDNQESTWGAVRFKLPARFHGEFTASLGDLAIGCESIDSGEIRIYLVSSDRAGQAAGLLSNLLRERGLDPAACAMSTEAVSDGRWAEAYQASLKPFRLGSRFLVIPARAASAESGLLPLVLVPGRAFGTGEHATTRLCVRLLERNVRPGERWLDLGCGSSILAMVAHYCGAAELLALDSDPDAIEVARDVLEANGLGDAIELRLGSLEVAGGRSWDGIVSNISGFLSITTVEGLAARLAPGGRLIASGFPCEEIEEIEALFRRSGLRTKEPLEEGGWAAIEALKPREGDS